MVGRCLGNPNGPVLGEKSTSQQSRPSQRRFSQETYLAPGLSDFGGGMPSNLQGLVESSRTSRWSQRLVKAPSWLGEAAACSKASCWLQEGVPNMEPSIPATSHQSRGNSRSLRIFLTVKSSAPCHIAAARLHEAAMLADSVSNCCLLYLGAG